jgi:uncharacterized delta-60 repeat protein
MKIINFLRLMAILLLFSPALSYGQAGTLDAAFNGTGKRLYDPGIQHDNAWDLVTLSDKKIMLCGTAKFTSSATSGYLMKLKENSDVETSWADDGIVELQFGLDTYAYEMEQLSDGKYLVSGVTYVTSTNAEFFVTRINTDGSLDLSFGGSNTGYALTAYSPSEEMCEAMAIQSDGKIVLAGRTYNGPFSQLFFTRFNADGTLDTDFGTNGYTEINSSIQDERINDLGILSNGTIVGFGYAYQSAPLFGEQPVMVKLDASGNPMTGFGTNGVLIPAIFDDVSIAQGLKIRNDSIFVTGKINTSLGNDMYLAKFDSMGVADPAFGDNGLSIISENEVNFGFRVMLQSDNKVYVSGSSGPNASGDREFMLVRFLSDGTTDNSFNNTGIVLTDFRPDWDDAYAMGAAVDGKIVLAGMSGGLTSSGDNKIPVARYLNDYVENQADFSADIVDICAGSSVNFTDESTGIPTSWEWTFEGGTPSSSTEQNPEVTYNTPGDYDVQLVVTYDAADNDTAFEENYIHVVNAVAAPGSPTGETSVCNNTNEVDYYTNPVIYANSYQWEVTPSDAGEINGDDTSAVFTPSSTWLGDYTIKVRATNACGDGPWSGELACTLYQSPELYTVGGGGSYCEGGDGVEVTLSDSDLGIDYELYYDGIQTGNIVAGTGDALSFGLVTDEGTYEVVGYNDNCSEFMMESAEVTIINAPNAPGTPTGPEEVCNTDTSEYISTGSTDATSYEWTLNPEDAGELTSDSLTATIIWDSKFAGTAELSLIALNDCGESNPSQVLTITVNAAPAASILGESTVCDYSTETYTTEIIADATYTWEVTGGTIENGQGTASIDVKWGMEGSGTIDLTVEPVTGCTGVAETFDVLIDNCTGIIGNNATDKIVLSPNPASNMVTIKGSAEIETIVLYNQLGMEVINKNANGNSVKINIASFNPGIYTVHIKTTNGIVIKKLIIK